MRLLRLLEPQEEAAIEDAADIVATYEARHAEWLVREMAYWSVDAIPDVVFLPVARIIAADIASSFGAEVPMEIDENGAPVSMGVKGMRDLKRITSSGPTGVATQAVYF
jgi:hypothetical protein